jgi:hypothetical protein
LGGLSIEIQGLKVMYLPKGIVLPVEHIENVDILEDRWIANHPRMRRVLMRLLPDFSDTYYLLHWSNGDDLQVLDEKVRNQRVTDADFDDALVCELRSLVCPNCSAVFRGVVVDTGHPLFARDRAQRLKEHSFLKVCPACGGDMSALVVEFVEQPAAELP